MEVNKFGSNIMSVKDKIDKLVEEHLRTIGKNSNKNVFCTSLELAELTGKEHYNVLKDIDRVYEELSKIEKLIKSDKKDALKFYGTLNNQRFVNISDIMDSNFRVLKGQYMSEQGKPVMCYYLDEIMYLTMINKYDNYTRYLMANFYVQLNQLTGYTVKQLSEMKEIQASTVEMIVWSKLCYDGIVKVLIEGDGRNNYKFIIKKNVTEEDKDNAKINLDTLNSSFWLGDSGKEMEALLETFDLKNWIPADRYLELTESLDSSYSSSRIVAELTRKEHFNVLNDIKSIIRDLYNKGIEETELANDFSEVTYKDAYGRDKPSFNLTLAGFITIMGRYKVEINYKLAEFYVEHRDLVIDYEKAMRTPVKDLIIGLEEHGKNFINKNELINEGDVKNDK